MTDWISIEDRWPDDGVPVLVYTDKGITAAKWTYVKCWESPGITRWWEPTAVAGEYGYEVFLESHTGTIPDKSVTHWQPLPPAP